MNKEISKCHTVVRNKKGEIIREYDQESEQKYIPKNDPEVAQGHHQLCGGGYRKRKIIYDKHN